MQFLTSVQSKLKIGQPNDRFEQEADRVADQVMQMPQSPPPIQRKCEDCEEEQLLMKPLVKSITPIIQKQSEEEEEVLQMKGLESQHIQTKKSEACPEISTKISQTKSSGSKLSKATNQFMSNAIGDDFSSVNIHTDSNAVHMNRSLNARAFTHGNDVYFNKGEYSPESSGGKHLLAHELTHVVQQSNSIQKKDDTQIYGESGITLTRANMETWDSDNINTNYWYNKLKDILSISFEYNAYERLKKSAEEAEVVLAALYESAPKSRLAEETIEYLFVPLEIGNNSKRIQYKLDFSPGIDASLPPMNSVSLIFVNEFANPIKSNDARDLDKKEQRKARNYKKRIKWMEKADPVKFEKRSFPGNDPVKFFENNPELEAYMYYRLKTAKKNVAFTDFIRRSEPVAHGFTESETLFLDVKYSGGVQESKAIYIGSQSTMLDDPDPLTSELPSGTGKRDYSDFKLEELQSKDHPEKGDRLGQISGLDQIPESEKLSVQYTLYNYFKGGTKPDSATRNQEIDIRIPIANSKETVLYTFIFHEAINKVVNVTIKRIGIDGQDFQETDPSSMDITRVADFPKTQDPVVLKKWTKQRYINLSVDGDDVPTIILETNKLINRGSGTSNWFKDRYKITVQQDASKAKKRVKNHTSIKEEIQLQDFKAFSKEELKYLELSLQQMSIPVLKRIRYTHLVRQRIPIDENGVEENYRGKANGYGTPKSKKYTVIIYDSAFRSNETLFRGGIEGVGSTNLGTMTHELGHIVSYKSGMNKKFNKYVEKHNIPAVTEYADSKPESEFFPEAFDLYHADPEWLRNNRPLVYHWFDTLDKTGSPPK